MSKNYFMNPLAFLIRSPLNYAFRTSVTPTLPMKLDEYIKQLTPLQRRNFARRVPTTEANLYQLAGGHSGPSMQMARAIKRASKHQVTLEDWEGPRA